MRTQRSLPALQHRLVSTSSTGRALLAAARCGLIALFVCLLAHTAQAQSYSVVFIRAVEPVVAEAAEGPGYAPDEAVRAPIPMSSLAWQANFGEQCARLLGSRITAVQEAALQNIVFFAIHNGDVLDFSEALPELLAIYANDRNEAHRIMALSALHAIVVKGDYGRLEEYVVQRLYEGMKEAYSERVRRLTRAALLDYAEAREE